MFFLLSCIRFIPFVHTKHQKYRDYQLPLIKVKLGFNNPISPAEIIMVIGIGFLSANNLIFPSSSILTFNHTCVVHSITRFMTKLSVRDLEVCWRTTLCINLIGRKSDGSGNKDEQPQSWVDAFIIFMNWSCLKRDDFSSSSQRRCTLLLLPAFISISSKT